MDGDEGEQEVLHNGETRKQRAKWTEQRKRPATGDEEDESDTAEWRRRKTQEFRAGRALSRKNKPGSRESGGRKWGTMNENHHRFRGCLFITLLKAHDRRVRRQTMAASFRPLVFQSCQAICGGGEERRCVQAYSNLRSTRRRRAQDWIAYIDVY